MDSSVAKQALAGDGDVSATTEDDSQTDDPALDYDAREDPWANVDCRDGREKRSIKHQEYKNQSTRHRHSKKGGPAQEPFEATLSERIDRLHDAAMSMGYASKEERASHAPFRIKVVWETGRTKRIYTHHNTDAIRIVMQFLVEVFRGNCKVYLQKRVGSTDRFHSGPHNPHVAVKITRDVALNRERFGLEPFIKNFNVPVHKTKLMELNAVKLQAKKQNGL